MPDMIGIDMEQLTEDIRRVNGKLDKLPQSVIDLGADEAAPYIVNVMRTYPPVKHEEGMRKRVYGSAFKTDRQRRWFFAALNSGELMLPYSRTQTLANSWQVIGQGVKTIIANETPYAVYVMDDKLQSKLLKYIGWSTVGKVIKDRMSRIMEKYNAGVKKAIKRLGLD